MLTESQFSSVEELVKAAGGTAVLYTHHNAAINGSRLHLEHNSRTIKPKKPEAPTSPAGQWHAQVRSDIEEGGFRMIPEAEVTKCILYKNSDTFCNPATNASQLFSQLPSSQIVGAESSQQASAQLGAPSQRLTPVKEAGGAPSRGGGGSRLAVGATSTPTKAARSAATATPAESVDLGASMPPPSSVPVLSSQSRKRGRKDATAHAASTDTAADTANSELLDASSARSASIGAGDNSSVKAPSRKRKGRQNSKTATPQASATAPVVVYVGNSDGDDGTDSIVMAAPDSSMQIESGTGLQPSASERLGTNTALSEQIESGSGTAAAPSRSSRGGANATVKAAPSRARGGRSQRNTQRSQRSTQASIDIGDDGEYERNSVLGGGDGNDSNDGGNNSNDSDDDDDPFAAASAPKRRKTGAKSKVQPSQRGGSQRAGRQGGKAEVPPPEIADDIEDNYDSDDGGVAVEEVPTNYHMELPWPPPTSSSRASKSSTTKGGAAAAAAAAAQARKEAAAAASAADADAAAAQKKTPTPARTARGSRKKKGSGSTASSTHTARSPTAAGPADEDGADLDATILPQRQAAAGYASQYTDYTSQSQSAVRNGSNSQWMNRDSSATQRLLNPNPHTQSAGDGDGDDGDDGDDRVDGGGSAAPKTADVVEERTGLLRTEDSRKASGYANFGNPFAEGDGSTNNFKTFRKTFFLGMNHRGAKTDFVKLRVDEGFVDEERVSWFNKAHEEHVANETKDAEDRELLSDVFDNPADTGKKKKKKVTKSSRSRR